MSFPYYNRGPYKWIPDKYAATTGEAFGVTEAYYHSVIDVGRPQNLLPEVPDVPLYANRTKIIGKNVLYSIDRSTINGSPNSINHPLVYPLLRSLVRHGNVLLESLPHPDIDQAIVMDSRNKDSYFFVSTENLSGKFASVCLEYMLYADPGYSQSPVEIYAVFDKNEVSNWLYIGGQIDDNTVWGPQSDYIVDDERMNSYLKEIGEQTGFSALSACPLRPVYKDKNSGQIIASSIGLDFIKRGNIDFDNLMRIRDRFSQTYVKCLPGYYTTSNFYPRLKGLLFSYSARANVHKDWMFILSGLRCYDAVPCNGVPQHISQGKNIESQFPCKVFGYALRISHAVQVSNSDMKVVYPSTNINRSSLRFRLYHPDYKNLGIAHGIKFYYLLVSARLYGTSPFSASFSLAGLLGGLATETDLVMIQWGGLVPGKATLNFFPMHIQHSNSGRTIYGGQYTYPSNIVAIRCFKKIGNEFIDIGQSILPELEYNYPNPLWYDKDGDNNTNYYVCPLSELEYQGYIANKNFPPANVKQIASFPATHLPDKGAFSLSATISTISLRNKKTTIHTKPPIVNNLRTKINDFMKKYPSSHVVTFISDEINTNGGSLRLKAGTWRIKISSSLSSVDNNLIPFIICRIGLVDTDKVDIKKINSYSVWNSDYTKEITFSFGEENEAAINVSSPTDSNYIMIPCSKSVSESTTELSILVNRTPGGRRLAADEEFDLNIPGKPEKVRLVWQLLAVLYSNDRNISPEKVANCPDLALSWGLNDESLQTTIIQVVSNQILFQQDNSTIDYTEREYNYIVLQDKGEQSAAEYGTDVIEYKNSFDVTSDNADRDTLKEGAILSDRRDVASNISIKNFSLGSRNYKESNKQFVDVAVASVQGELAGCVIEPQNTQCFLNYSKNVDLYDAYMRIDLLVVDQTTYDARLISSSGYFNLDNISGEQRFNINIPRQIVIPSGEQRLVIRFNIWPYKKRAVIGTDKFLLNISNFYIEFPSGLRVNASQITSTNKNWFLGLPVTTQTFGSADYTFVADTESTRTVIMPPSTVSNWAYWYLYGWLFSPFWKIEMPYGSIIEINDLYGLTDSGGYIGTGLSVTERNYRGLYIRTAIDTISKYVISADISSTYHEGYIRITKPVIENNKQNQYSIITIKDSGVYISDAVAYSILEEKFKVNNNDVESYGLFVKAQDREIYTSKIVGTHCGNTSKIAIYENTDFDYEDDVSNVLLAIDKGSGYWQNPMSTSNSISRGIIISKDITKVACDIDKDGIIYLVGYRPYNKKNPQAGGCLLLRTINPMTSDDLNTGKSNYRYVSGLLDKNDKIIEIIANRNRIIDDEPVDYCYHDIAIVNQVIYIFYSKKARNDNEAEKCLGKIFCKVSYDGGQTFSNEMIVCDLGYSQARERVIHVSSGDSSFMISDIVAAVDQKHQTVYLFFVAGEKLFMKILPTRLASEFARPDLFAGNYLYAILGGLSNIEKITDNHNIGLDQWLKYNWISSSLHTMISNISWNFLTDKIVDYIEKSNINIVKIADDIEAFLPQRIGAIVSPNKGKLQIFYIDRNFSLVKREITVSSDASTEISASMFRTGNMLISRAVKISSL